MIMLAAIVYFCMPSVSHAVELTGSTKEPTRTINLVYDDSTSMIQSDSTQEFVDTWCKAKYALEVFAAMLGETDTLNVYYMSDSNKPMILSGEESSENRVKKVHRHVTDAGYTPFGSVKRAMIDLEKAPTDEKWLVVLTDGAFQERDHDAKKLAIGEINKFFESKPPNIKVMFMGMGSEANEIEENPGKSIFFKKAENSTDILNSLTNIGQTVFNRAPLKVKNNNRILFDVPMKELVVFAQGKGIAVKDIRSKNGKSFSSDQSTKVTYTKKDNATQNKETDFDKNKIKEDRTLWGTVSTFKRKFNAGTYDIDIDGKENLKTIEVYYKPDVDVNVFLKDKDGREVKDRNLKAGEYGLGFVLVKGGTKEKVNSNLLGNITYEAKVTNNGKKLNQVYKPGDKVKIEEGDLHIDATATYLKQYRVSTALEKTIFKNKEIGFSVKNDPDRAIKDGKFTTDEPTQIKCTLDGKDFTEEEWAQLDEKNVRINPSEEPEFEIGSFRTGKSDEPGILNVYPTLPGKLSGKEYHDLNLDIVYKQNMRNKATWEGSGKVKMKMGDKRSFFEKNKDRIIKIFLGLLILILLLGYLLKKRLPKNLRKSPTITAVPTAIGYTGGTFPGKFTKDTASVILPFVAEKGTIRFVPKTVRGIPALKVKGAGGRKMNIRNIQSYAGKDQITFNGNPVPEGTTKPLKVGGGLLVEVTTAGRRYSCQTNQ